ncbi:MAG: hypothetical protein ACJA2Q_000491 [Pseudohongiellaceae bacterium]|jgi:hypothetical protein
MTLKIIEFNDGAIKVGDHSGIVASSPGFALVVGNELVLGERAEKQARLQPTKSYNKYWYDLSMEPLNHGNHLRHTADIAFAHLLHLAEIGEIESDVVLAVPGSFSSQQLAILLGLAKHSPINPIGVIDSGLAAGVAASASAPSLIIDFQLHQIVVTKLASSNGLLTSESVVQIPGVGSQNFINLMMQQATDSFIQQCRFNPQHNAEYEQLLYNQMPLWLSQYDDSQTNLVLELKTRDALHVAKMPKEGLIASLQGHYKKINQELEPLLEAGYSSLILNKDLASLPGYMASLPDFKSVKVLQDDAIIEACLGHAEKIVTDSDEIHLVRSLAVAVGAKVASAADKAEFDTTEVPTHLVFQNRAVALNGMQIRNAVTAEGVTNANSINVAAGDLPSLLGEISVNSNGAFIDGGELEFYLNLKPVKGLQRICLGDQVQFTTQGEALTVIQVQNV